MSKITEAMIQKSFKIGKKFYEKKITLKEGLQILIDIGMNKNSASDYVYCYSNMIQGKVFTRTTNLYATDYFLKNIYELNGTKGLENALLSLSQHIEYYEEKSGSSVKNRKEIYTKYLKLIIENENSHLFPDELDSKIEYAEGKAKMILVNSYERNPIARKKCIDYFGLSCQVCGFNFQEKYGILGQNFIHVHHIIDIATINHEYSVDPIKDLIPVCPNCHAMLHKEKPAISVNELKKILVN